MAEEASPTFQNFNPTGNEHVAEIKKRTDELIAYVKANGKDGRRVSLAVTHYETGAMFAVKSLFSGND